MLYNNKITKVVENSSSQPYPVSGLAVIVSIVVLRSYYYSLIKSIQLFVFYCLTNYECSITLSLLLSLLHVVVIIYNLFVIKRSLSVIALFYNIKFICDNIITRYIFKILLL